MHFAAATLFSKANVGAPKVQWDGPGMACEPIEASKQIPRRADVRV
jgi:hypothetical protein